MSSIPGMSRSPPHDTIVAIATPPGRGGLGVIRISGPDASRIASELIGRSKPLKPRHATFATVAIGARHQPASAITSS